MNTIRKIRDSKKRQIPWNKGRKGLQIAWNKGTKGVMKSWNKGLIKEKQPNFGKKLSEETKRKIGLANSIALKGKKLSEEHKRKISEVAKEKGFGKWMVGKKLSLETRKKISESQKGKLSHPMTDDIKKKISEAKMGSRHSEETRRKMSEVRIGEKHPNWQGGKSFEPYTTDWTKTLKLAIRQRDNFICQKCGKTEKEELKELNRVLSVNHIDFDKTNCDPKNLNTLCGGCNASVNFNREYWTNYFQIIANVTDINTH